jgi:hypothetical protein
MVNENKILFYSEELNEDITQNNNLLNSREVLIQKKTNEQINSNSYNSIVDSIDYLGCINGNCSKIKCDCNDLNCDCKQSSNNHSNNNHNNHNHNNHNHNNHNHNNSKNFISNLIDFLFVLFIVIFLIFILYKRNSEQLIYVLGITIIYIFYKIYVISS